MVATAFRDLVFASHSARTFLKHDHPRPFRWACFRFPNLATKMSDVCTGRAKGTRRVGQCWPVASIVMSSVECLLPKNGKNMLYFRSSSEGLRIPPKHVLTKFITHYRVCAKRNDISYTVVADAASCFRNQLITRSDHFP